METVNILIEALPYIKKFHQKKDHDQVWWTCNDRF